MNEAALLHRLRLFDEESLIESYDLYSPELYLYAMRLTGDRKVAEECVAEVFARLLSVMRNGKGPENHLRAYLYRMAHNWITDQYRRKRPEMHLDPQMRASEMTEPQVISGHMRVQQELRTALQQLTPDQRQVVALKYLEELDNAEIAEMLQKPVGAVKALQHRALATLRRLLGSAAEDGENNQSTTSLESWSSRG
jgi:RNA polymerase sigma-70 factor, ECF subfamily